MCIILDTNILGEFKDPDNEDMEPVWKWLENRDGKIVYSNAKEFENEWWTGGGRDSLVEELNRAGKLKLELQSVKEKGDELKGKIESDDEYIIALAIIAGVKVLVSKDKELIRDFKNRDLVGGKVYQKKAHVRLLTKDTCP
jgi:predicted nucleic acid-binding protein